MTETEIVVLDGGKLAVEVSILLPPEAHQFFQKVGFNYERILIDALKSYLEAWQLAECEQGKNLDKALFEESREVFKLLGEPDRGVDMETVEGILSGKYPVGPKIWSREK